MNILKLSPVYFEKPWGGISLTCVFDRDLPENVTVGESWEICDRNELSSLIVGGSFNGLSIRQAILKDAPFIMGENWDKSRHFPIMIKWLDCSAQLSIQVHPNDVQAKKFNAEAKSECYYIHHCSPNSSLIAGLKEDTSKESLLDSIQNKSMHNILQSVDTKKGDIFFIPAGTVHSLGAGNLALEIQENSDTTYRIYDWGRPRTLHLEEALDSINFQDQSLKKSSTKDKNKTHCSCPAFSLRTLSLKAGESFSFNAKEQTRIISITEGTIQSSCGSILNPSDSAILPFAQAQNFTALSDSLVFITENFSK